MTWVDTDKGTDGCVARDFHPKGEKDREDLFAATPPLEAKRMLMSKATTRWKKGGIRKMMFIDARKAHLNPECEGDVYIELPREAGAGPGKVGKLNYWLYGFRPAAQAWERHYSEKLEKVGFERGESSAVCFLHRERDVACVVHGDDFTFEGEEKHLKWIQNLMKSWFEIKVRGILGPERNDDKEVTILGRVVKWKSWGIEFQADPRHRREVMKHFGFEDGSRELSGTNGLEEGEECDEEVEEGEAREFRGVAARMNYLAQDSPEVQFATKEVCRGMAKPTRSDWKRLKKLARFVVGRCAVVWEYRYQDEGQEMRVKTDSDWAGCKRTRKSSSGGVLMIGAHCLKTWCSTQGALALSSAEAEYYAMVEGVLRAVGMRNVGKELGLDGVEMTMILETDSSAAKGFVSRRGRGRMRHMEVKWLWLQDQVRRGNVRVIKLKGTENAADLMTKYLNRSEIVERLQRIGLRLEAKGE